MLYVTLFLQVTNYSSTLVSNNEHIYSNIVLFISKTKAFMYLLKPEFHIVDKEFILTSQLNLVLIFFQAYCINTTRKF